MNTEQTSKNIFTYNSVYFKLVEVSWNFILVLLVDSFLNTLQEKFFFWLFIVSVLYNTSVCFIVIVSACYI